MIRVPCVFIMFYLMSGFMQGQGLFKNKTEIVLYTRDIFIQDFDSVIISYKLDNSKETTLDLLEVEGERPEKKWELSAKEINNLNRILNNENSYSNQLSGLGHRDISIRYYQGNTLVLSLLISSITRDISISDEVNVLGNCISIKFEKFLTKILYRKRIWENNMGFMEF